jgi:hypothetical protein
MSHLEDDVLVRAPCPLDFSSGYRSELVDRPGVPRYPGIRRRKSLGRDVFPRRGIILELFDDFPVDVVSGEEYLHASKIKRAGENVNLPIEIWMKLDYY